MTTPEQPAATPDATPSVIEVVSDSLPDFLTSDPYLWFVQLEATFADKASEATKHKKCVSKLPQIVLPQVSDLLTASTSYTELKKRLLALYGKSRETLVSTLLNGIRMGDEKPSMLLRRMQYMAGSSDADEYLKSLWLRALPNSYRLQLALSSATSLMDLAAEADKLAAAAALNNLPDESSAKIAALTDQISTGFQASDNMQPLMTPQDYKEAAKRERYKQIEEERRKRIFNAKQRLIGIDFEALERQIQEKKERERQEALEEELWNKKQAQDMNIVNAREKQLEEDKQRAIKELNEYRCQFQKWENRREFDLNDPVSYYTPLNIDPDDKRFGISSLTRFEGQEDYPGSRQKIQLDQQHAWLQQQMIERNQQKCAQKTADLALEQAEIAEGMRFRALKELEDQCRREQTKKTAEFNKALAVKKMQQKFEEMKREIEDVTTHKMNTLTSDMLTENREAADSGLGSGRVNAANYKGMSEAEKAEIKRIQLEQIQETHDRKRKEELDELAWIEYQRNLQQSVRFIDMRLAAESKKKDEQLRQVNKNLMEEQKAHRDYLEKYVYTNSCSDDYFKQFNTSTR